MGGVKKLSNLLESVEVKKTSKWPSKGLAAAQGTSQIRQGVLARTFTKYGRQKGTTAW